MGGKAPPLPAGFAEQHNKAAAASETTTGFRTKKEYLGLFNQVREETLGRWLGFRRPIWISPWRATWPAWRPRWAPCFSSWPATR